MPPRPTALSQPRQPRPTRSRAIAGWTPWLILCVFVFVWGMPQVAAGLDGLWLATLPVPGLHELVQRVPPVVAQPRRGGGLRPQHALGHRHRHPARGAHLRRCCWATRRRDLCDVSRARSGWSAISLLTIAACWRSASSPATRARTRPWAWRSRNRAPLSVLRHAARLARRGAHRLGYRVERALRQPADDHRRAARPQSDADGRGQQLRRRDGQDDRRAEHRRRLHRHQLVRPRGPILRYVFFHSLALARLVGMLVMGQAYVWPFTLFGAALGP